MSGLGCEREALLEKADQIHVWDIDPVLYTTEKL
jgi:hypothetical protein